MPGIEIVYLCFGHGRVFVDSGGKVVVVRERKFGAQKERSEGNHQLIVRQGVELLQKRLIVD